MKSIPYFNGGVDMLKFPWHWDEMKEIHSDEQIAMMKRGKVEWKQVPNVVGMEAKKAYRYMTDLGFGQIVVFS